MLKGRARKICAIYLLVVLHSWAVGDARHRESGWEFELEPLQRRLDHSVPQVTLRLPKAASPPVNAGSVMGDLIPTGGLDRARVPLDNISVPDRSRPVEVPTASSAAIELLDPILQVRPVPQVPRPTWP